VPIGARTAPPGGGSESRSGSLVGDGAEHQNLALSVHNLIANATFADGTSLPWTPRSRHLGPQQRPRCSTGRCVQLRHREMTIQEGHQYTVSFTAHAPETAKPAAAALPAAANPPTPKADAKAKSSRKQ
jgi:hypothetical protein